MDWNTFNYQVLDFDRSSWSNYLSYLSRRRYKGGEISLHKIP
jgi:hypothetical protein